MDEVYCNFVAELDTVQENMVHADADQWKQAMDMEHYSLIKELNLDSQNVARR